MKCQICGAEFSEEKKRVITLFREVENFADVGVCEGCLKDTEEYLVSKASHFNLRGALEANLAEQRRK